MQVSDIVSRVAAMLDDDDQTYITTDYVLNRLGHEYDKLYTKLLNCGSQFDTVQIECPDVQAGLPNLDGLQASGGVLQQLLQPRMVEWKLAGQPTPNYLRADGPLDQIRDIQAGIPMLDSWAWVRQSLKLSNFGQNLDLRITGDFLFDPLNAPDNTIELALNCNVTLACMVATAIAKSRGNANWVTQYSADSAESFDELAIALTKAQLSKTRRLARVCRPNLNPALGSQIPMK